MLQYIYAFKCSPITYFNLLYFHMDTQGLSTVLKAPPVKVWYGILEFNVPLNTVLVISETNLLKCHTAK